jgi:UDP-N-acetylmuramoyl-tripeptide--D-alanyl-D-alanine ligase
MGIITNIGHSHLEKLRSVKGVKREKGSLLQFLGERGVLVTNGDCEECRELAAEFSGKTITVAIEQEADITATIIDENDSNLSLRIGDLQTRLALSGAHNACNALLAAAAAEELGVERKDALKAFASLSPPKMRMHTEVICGVTIIDDTYNSNFESLKAALMYLESLRARARKILLVGDMLELGSATERLHKAIGRNIRKSGIDILITVGQWAGLIAQEAQRGHVREVFQMRTVDEIAPLLTRLVRTGDAVLFKASRAVHLENAVEEFKNRLRENYLVTVNCAR